MDRIVIKGGKKLEGKVKISGSKNTALPIMAASLLASSPVTLHNVPKLQDIETMIKMLKYLGAEVTRRGKTLYIDPTNFSGHTAPYDMVRKMRASIYVLGPMIARLGGGEVSHPGGCAIGPRPIDLHLKGFAALGVDIKIEHGYVITKADCLKGSDFSIEGLSGPSIGATCNTMMVAAMTPGESIIRGAAHEPEIIELSKFLNAMGAKVRGAGTSTIEITGVKNLQGAEFRVIPDRIETGTFMTAAAITRGEVHIEDCEPEHLTSTIDKLSQIGVPITVSKKSIWVKPTTSFKPIAITTLPYPGFPTDMQAQFMALLSIAEGTSTIVETIYKERFIHVAELNRMGAQIHLTDATAVISGVGKLSGAPVMASDLRASAALIIAGLVAEGETEILRVYHIDRGYEKIEDKLNSLGADVVRIKETTKA